MEPKAILLKLITETQTLRVHLCADEVVIVTVDPRTGRLNLRDTGDLAAAGRGPRFTAISEKLNENPIILLDALVRLRLHVSLIPFTHYMNTHPSIHTDYYRPRRAKSKLPWTAKLPTTQFCARG